MTDILISSMLVRPLDNIQGEHNQFVVLNPPSAVVLLKIFLSIMLFIRKKVPRVSLKFKRICSTAVNNSYIYIVSPFIYIKNIYIHILNPFPNSLNF